MHLRRTISGKKGEQGIVILLVAVVLLFVVGAMAVLAIDLVSFYTARSEAQLAADSAALAGARVLANSGVTSNPADTNLSSNAQAMARTIAAQVAASNKVGGRNLNPATEVSISFLGASIGGSGLGPNPRVSVRVSRNDVPTFFARIWGSTQLALSATAIAEAYNSSFAGGSPPVAPTCVKPWVLPNLDPRDNNPIFDPSTGAIQNHGGLTPPTLLGYTDMTGALRSRCNNCGFSSPHDPATRTPLAWRFYPGAEADFPVPTQSLPTCNVALNNYQTSIAGCVSKPIACNSSVNLDHNITPPLVPLTNQAVNCLSHSVPPNPSGGDQVVSNPAVVNGQPFQFEAGDNNPAVNARGKNIMVSDSLVIVPVYNSNGNSPGFTPVTIVGFAQLFLNSDGNPAPPSNPFVGVNATVVNLVGCGTGSTGTPILGNGASPVAVRLVARGSGT